MSQRIRQVFPTVRKIAIQVTFTDADQASDMSWREYALTPEAEHPVKFGCPDRECISGGFDLSEAISEAVASNLTVTQGDLGCPGWAETAGGGKARCLVGLYYRLKIDYVAT